MDWGIYQASNGSVDEIANNIAAIETIKNYYSEKNFISKNWLIVNLVCLRLETKIGKSRF